MRDFDLVKKRHLVEHLGVFDSDLDTIGEKLLPRLPRVLEQLHLEDHHFGGQNFAPEFKLAFMASFAVLASSQARLDDVGRSGTWTVRQSMDPNDRNYCRPIGLRENL